ncbi:class I SAM-dependent methyltransferase [Roseococcus sp. SDR]|uniref:class I SAM-dependent methyltransferase n=1 Tax=Roseococcus sp. SDR TaxID=2835532 RepID=UPI001BCB4843|nr:class I SAM-dependent methyltransferase [Roseococcus sp. SDR]MBS7788961.1 class I SAM-dependent methyltransferase [Roseococcus sp. SDR]MBV1844275.1 class I SAM-dependent methyltransferase [Roseococcus sp. SDR]
MSKIEIFSAKAANFEADSSMPSMLSLDEKALYRDVARQYRGEGEVIEIGSWLGSGTIEICRGLEETGEDWRLTVIDRFRWSKLYMTRYPEVPLTEGASFLEMFQANMGEHAARMTCLQAELQDLPKVFEPPAKIELLFVDAPKSWSMLRSVLEHLGPRLLPGGSVVFQDFLHITSRQLVWLLASIPELRPVRLVESGTAAVFRVEAPVNLRDQTVPRSISSLGVEELLRIWRHACDVFPAARSGELSVGMALDLLNLQADDAAEDVLAHAQAAEANGVLADEVERLARYSDRQIGRALTMAGAYLRGGVRPRASRAALEVMAEEDATIGGNQENVTLRGLSSEALAGLAKALRLPKTGRDLATRYAIHARATRQDISRLVPLFDAAVRSGAVLQAAGVADLALGRDVVELTGTMTLHGVALRALGARSYAAVNPRHDPAQRTYTGGIAGLRHRSAIRLGDVEDMIPFLTYSRDADALRGTRFDLAIIDAPSPEISLDSMLATAARLLRPDGVLCVRWQNAYAWSGHGRRPQRASEIDRNDPSQATLLDWRHIRHLRPRPLTLTALREQLEAVMSIQEWRPQAEDPAVVMRLRDKVLAANPDLTLADLTTSSVTVVGRLAAVKQGN